MTLIKGLFAKDKHEKAPDFVKCDISIKRLDLLEFLTTRNEEWINCQLLRSKDGKLYIAENDYKPEKKKDEPKNEKNNLPF
jgi:hypothetical protein